MNYYREIPFIIDIKIGLGLNINYSFKSIDLETDSNLKNLPMMLHSLLNYENSGLLYSIDENIDDVSINEMLESFNKKAEDFCHKNNIIHSVWIEVNKTNKEITICTLFDKPNFDAEHKVFTELYTDLPLFMGEYSIERAMRRLHGRKPMDILPDTYKYIYLRDKKCQMQKAIKNKSK